MTDKVDRWNHLYKDYLPSLAKAKDQSQNKWPVNLDHCFARIILDNAVGIDRPWTEVLKSPAYKNMSDEQFDAAIALGERIASGEEPDLLVQLDNQSLELRGKTKGKKQPPSSSQDETPPKGKKRPAPRDTPSSSPPPKKSKPPQEDKTISKYFLPSPPPAIKPEQPTDHDQSTSTTTPSKDYTTTMAPHVSRILSSPTLTPFRKLSLILLTQIPPGHYSTYSALSTFITQHYHKTCARAVGSAMKNNPFAPQVPCHRIIAADGKIGGFKGGWGEEGKYAQQKYQLLKGEGVGFDSAKKVKGPVWRGYWKVQVPGLESR